jgi:transposase-like protein
MAKIIPITEHFQHFLAEIKESFWGDVYGQTKQAWKQFFEADSQRQRDRYAVREAYHRRRSRRQPYRRLLRAGFREPLRYHPATHCTHPGKEFSAARTGTVSAAGGRGGDADPGGVFARPQHAANGASGEHSDRRSGEPADGVEVDPQSGPGGAPVSPGPARRRLRLSVSGRSEPARAASGGTQAGAHAGGLRVRGDGSRHLLAFMRSQGESQADWEGLLGDLYRRGLEGQQLGLIVTDGGAGLAAAIPTVYPRVRHQRCWVHKMRNILEKVRKRDYAEVKTGAQAIYLAESRAHAEAAFRRFRARWQREYGPMVRRLQRDLPELLSFFAFPRHLWRKLRTTNVIERCFVEVRRRTRPMVCFVNVESVDRIIYSIFQRFNLEWKTRTLNLFTQAA